MKHSHRIKVLGKEITVRSEADPEHVQEVERFVNRKIAEAQAAVPVGDPQVPVILALMNMAESCLALQKERQGAAPQLDEVATRRLLQRLDDVLRR